MSKFNNDPFYYEIFFDTTLMELSQTIFGEIPGTEQIFKKRE